MRSQLKQLAIYSRKQDSFEDLTRKKLAIFVIQSKAIRAYACLTEGDFIAYLI